MLITLHECPALSAYQRWLVGALAGGVAVLVARSGVPLIVQGGLALSGLGAAVWAWRRKPATAPEASFEQLSAWEWQMRDAYQRKIPATLDHVRGVGTLWISLQFEVSLPHTHSRVVSLWRDQVDASTWRRLQALNRLQQRGTGGI